MTSIALTYLSELILMLNLAPCAYFSHVSNVGNGRADLGATRTSKARLLMMRGCSATQDMPKGAIANTQAGSQMWRTYSLPLWTGTPATLDAAFVS